ncbi:MAG: hypothetical protein QGG48_06670, partial [Desulfatiglandales bacterium]|nr:hypothetical protein [Desulfatiglandales bacterium]
SKNNFRWKGRRTINEFCTKSVTICYLLQARHRLEGFYTVHSDGTEPKYHLVDRYARPAPPSLEVARLGQDACGVIAKWQSPVWNSHAGRPAA